MKFTPGKMNSNMWALVIFSLVFALVYKFSLWYASQLGDVSSFVFDFEQNIPFLPWTIIPYLSSGFFFFIVFLLIESDEDLKIFLKRVLLMVFLAGLGFVLFPLQYSYPKPEVNNDFYASLFWFLDGVDDPYNQSPSLHVAFAFAFWTVFREMKSPWKNLAGFWLILVALSTLTTFQHHLIDVFTGSILAHLAFILIPSRQNNFGIKNQHIANYNYLFGWISLLISFLLAKYFGNVWYNLSWFSALLFVGGYLCQKFSMGYLRRDVIRIKNIRRFF